MAIDIELLGDTIPADDLSQIADLAMQAFFDDRFFIFLSPRPKLRTRGLRIFFRAVVKHLGPGRVVYVARDRGEIVGVSAWTKPGLYPAPLADQFFQSILAGWALFLRPRALFDGLRYISAMDREHPKDPIWYLALLAVAPKNQRQGLGGRLQDPILEVCDSQGFDSYLETQKEDNLAYYRRFGYEMLNILQPRASGPPLWTMRRRAKTS